MPRSMHVNYKHHRVLGLLYTVMNETVTRSVDAEVQVCVGTETINDAVLDVKHEKTHCINATAIIF